MNRQELEEYGLTNIAFPALYVPIDDVDHLAAGTETAKQAIRELSHNGLKWRIVRGGMALLVETLPDARILQKYQSWLHIKGCSAEIVE